MQFYFFTLNLNVISKKWSVNTLKFSVNTIKFSVNIVYKQLYETMT